MGEPTTTEISTVRVYVNCSNIELFHFILTFTLFIESIGLVLLPTSIIDLLSDLCCVLQVLCENYTIHVTNPFIQQKYLRLVVMVEIL